MFWLGDKGIHAIADIKNYCFLFEQIADFVSGFQEDLNIVLVKDLEVHKPNVWKTEAFCGGLMGLTGNFSKVALTVQEVFFGQSFHSFE